MNTGIMDCEMEEETSMFPTHITEAVNNAVLNNMSNRVAPDINIKNCNNCTIYITLN